jgi:hypothetical protein
MWCGPAVAARRPRPRWRRRPEGQGSERRFRVDRWPMGIGRLPATTLRGSQTNSAPEMGCLVRANVEGRAAASRLLESGFLQRRRERVAQLAQLGGSGLQCERLPVRSEQIRIVNTPARSPQANALAERFSAPSGRNASTGCSSSTAATSTTSCASTSTTTTARGRTGRSPCRCHSPPPRAPTRSEYVRRRDRLGGVIHEYERAAA